MKRKGIFLIGLVVVLCFAFISCQKALKPDTPANAAWLMKIAIDEGDYKWFQSLFTETRKDAVSAEMFDEMGGITTAGTSFIQYSVLTFENGEMILVRLSPETKGEYKIEDVMIVPDDMKAFFEEN